MKVRSPREIIKEAKHLGEAAADDNAAFQTLCELVQSLAEHVVRLEQAVSQQQQQKVTRR